MALNFGCRLGWIDHVLYGRVVSSVLSPGVQGELSMKTDATDDTLMDYPAVHTALTIAIDFGRRDLLGECAFRKDMSLVPNPAIQDRCGCMAEKLLI